MSRDGLDPDGYEIGHFSWKERAARKTRLVARAHDERSRLLRQWTDNAVRPLALAWRVTHKIALTAARQLLVRQRRMAEVRQLAAMSDLELRDIGITRTEVRAAARSEAIWPRHGLRASPTTPTTQGEKHAESLLDCPRLGS
jgi:uncharacterized protein YjiS (DUF1127 family)